MIEPNARINDPGIVPEHAVHPPEANGRQAVPSRQHLSPSPLPLSQGERDRGEGEGNKGEEAASLTQPAKETAPSPAPPRDNGTREVLDTVVLVAVFWLLAKVFVVEPFVIPTGSMAETLWGYQKIVTCPYCGYPFPVNCSRELKNEERTTRCACPNCRNPIEFTSQRESDTELQDRYRYKYP